MVAGANQGGAVAEEPSLGAAEDRRFGRRGGPGPGRSGARPWSGRRRVCKLGGASPSPLSSIATRWLPIQVTAQSQYSGKQNSILVGPSSDSQALASQLQCSRRGSLCETEGAAGLEPEGCWPPQDEEQRPITLAALRRCYARSHLAASSSTSAWLRAP